MKSLLICNLKNKKKKPRRGTILITARKGTLNRTSLTALRSKTVAG
jgi:hypothetical protein